VIKEKKENGRVISLMSVSHLSCLSTLSFSLKRRKVESGEMRKVSGVVPSFLS